MFHSLGDYQDEKVQKDKRRTTDSYAGGKSSGLSIMNPEDKQKKEKNGKTKKKLKQKSNTNTNKNDAINIKDDDDDFGIFDWSDSDRFMEKLDKGGLLNKGYNDLGIDLDEERDSDYEIPKEEEKKFHAFSGVGKSVSSVNTKGLHVKKNVSSHFDKKKPVCKVNIRLFNGEVISEDFNLCQTLKDIIEFVKKKSGSTDFELVDGFPPKPLTEYHKTIQELNIEGSLLTQKINEVNA